MFRPTQRVYAVVHSGTFHELFRSPVTARSAQHLLRHVAGIVFLSESIANASAPWIPSHHRLVIPNTIDDAVVCTNEEIEAKHARGPSATWQLLFASNMLVEKGYLDVLAAVRLLKSRGIDVHLGMAGSWPSDGEKRRFEHLVHTHDLANDVTHHGAITDRNRMKELYLGADVFLLPTYHPTEGQPLAILEAMNAGTPIITTRHGGIPSLVEHDQHALFVNPRDPGAIADALRRLFDHETWHRLSAAARERFDERFTPVAIKARWLDLISARCVA